MRPQARERTFRGKVDILPGKLEKKRVQSITKQISKQVFELFSGFTPGHFQASNLGMPDYMLTRV